MSLELRRVLVALDFGDSSRRALEVAIDLADRFGAELTVLHVCEVPVYAYGGMTFSTADLIGPVEDAAREQLERTLRDVQARRPGAKAILRNGGAAQEILAAVDETGADLVVLGTHGRHGVSRALLGSVAERVVRLSSVPVLTVRETARP